MRKIELLWVVAISLVIIGCANQERYIQNQGMVWNTTYNIIYKSDKDLSDSINAVLKEIDQSASVFNKNSIVSELNVSDSLSVDTHLVNLYGIAKKVFNLSGGMFDPTLSPLIDAWGFGKGHKVNPQDTCRIDEILQYVGLGKTECKNGYIIKEDKRIQFNFSSVAKGYGCDAVAEMLKRSGVKDYMVEIGGEIALGGESPRGSKWNISIDRPVASDSILNHESQCIISLTDCGMATSGNYRNFRSEGGRRIAHTISPVTGRPIQTDVLSATVIAPSSAEADALATACMAVGSEKARVMFDKLKYPVYLILTDSTSWSNPQFDKLLVEN